MKKLMLYFAAFILAASGAANALAQSSGDCSSPATAYPGGVGVRNITTNAATIHWNAVPGARGYAISVGSADLDPKTWPTYNACKPAEMAYSVAGLVPGKTYRARVRALCESCFRSFGPSVTQWSQDIEFTTLTGAENQNPQGPPVPNFPVLIQDPTQQPGDYVINWPGKPNPPTDPEEPNEPTDPAGGRYTIAGYVIDAWHRPVASARVKRGSVETLTDAKGRFVFTVNETRPAATTPVLVVVEKDGYWRNASRQYLHAQDTTETTLMLREQTVTNRVDATKGGEMLYKRFSLELPPNGVQTEDGTPYTGTILLSVDGATPAERDFGLRMPGGDFSAIDANNNDVMLYSYGFLSAEMKTTGGQKLEFRPGAEATLRFNLPWDETHRPDSVPLWHFNETTAIWEQEGWTVKNGSVYEGRVRHFSSWNCDYPALRGTVKGRVIDCNDQPMKGGWVDVGQRRVYSDAKGEYWAWVPGGIIFDARTASDTLLDLSVPAQQEQMLADMRTKGYGGLGVWNPKTQELKVHLSGIESENLSLSIDGGQTWTQQLQWTDVPSAPDEVRLKGTCMDRLRVVTELGKTEDCRKFDSQTLKFIRGYADWESAFLANDAVNRLSFGQYSFGDNWNLLSAFPCLQSLHIEFDRLISVPESFGANGQFRELNLRRNELTGLPESFGNLGQLQTLYLDYNQLASLPESFGNLSQLKELRLDVNRLSSLPESFGNLNQLEELLISHNQLTRLPESFGNLRQLRTLKLSDNQSRLAGLPESFGNLSQLRVLSLKGNQLSSLPESFGNLSQLTNLGLSNNHLTSLPESFGNLGSLRILHLHENKITSLPQSFGNLNQLVELYIHNNHISILPDNFGGLSQLTELRLTGNRLTSLPPSIGNLDKLIHLSLANNQLTDLPVSIANLADTLRYLYLNGNPIPVERRAAIQALLPNTLIQW